MTQYQKLSKDNLPPINNHRYFILWRGVNEGDGGVPSLAKHVQYNGMAAYIRFVTADGWKTLEKKEYRFCVWAPLETPDENRMEGS